MNLKTNKMKLIKITKNGSLHFKLNDGRIGVTYESGYVRVSTKGGAPERFYQINKQRYNATNRGKNYFYTRDLIPNHIERVQRLLDFNARNCK
jgi:hypothetical protein